MKNSTSLFNETAVLGHIKHYLPAQAPLKDFIHHNTLHAFQHDDFHAGLAQASSIFGYKVYLEIEEYRTAYKEGKIDPAVFDRVLNQHVQRDDLPFYRMMLLTGPIEYQSRKRIGELRKYWKTIFKTDLDSRVHPNLFKIVGSYLDQGISTWHFPSHESGFLASIRALENNSFVSLFKSRRVKELLLNEATTLSDLLHILVGREELFEHYLFDQQFGHPGWSGMVSVIETNPGTLLKRKTITLNDFIFVECLMEIDAIDDVFGDKWDALGQFITAPVKELFREVQVSINDRLLMIWHEAFEWSYYNQVLLGIAANEQSPDRETPPEFQAVFCIDDRECSIRRYVEQGAPDCETFGTPGHFNLEFYFQPENGKFTTKVCPAPLSPTVLIREFENRSRREKDIHFSKQYHSFFVGAFMTGIVGAWSAVRLAFTIFRPRTSPLTSASGRHMDPHSKLQIENTGEFSEDGLQLGFTHEQMADRLEGLLKSIGLVSNFAPVIYAFGHGSTSVNNTHFAGYDCGACSGRPGSVNARVISYIGNHKTVRSILATRGLVIPDSTVFIGALHDTSRDEATFFDIEKLSQEKQQKHAAHKAIFIKALDLNAKERSRRFMSTDTSASAAHVHNQVKKRTVSLFEPRPELNHATNALCIVGRRSFSKGVFLDRRAFMNSYDYRVDTTGSLLEGILNAAAPVCGGINLEYYFSRVDNQQLGAGTKLPHNVIGLIGVANGIEGDLRTGLPSQMIEVHDPVRLMVIVEQFPDFVLEVIQRNPRTYEWFSNNWVHLVASNPETGALMRFENGVFVPCQLVSKPVEQLIDVLDLIEQNDGNLPVYLYKTAR